jgi:hypothetical protein
MMFLVRSTFWLGIVVSNMPLDHADLAGAARAACAQQAASCRVILAAAEAGLAARPDRSLEERGATLAVATGKARRPSANSLNAADLATPWRGRPAKSGA